MKIQFPYGRDSFLALDLPDESVLYAHTQEEVENIPLTDLPSAVTQALENPLNVPPLRECLMSDDHLVIPVAPEVPHVGTILQASRNIIQALRHYTFCRARQTRFRQDLSLIPIRRYNSGNTIYNSLIFRRLRFWL